jgi:hypothetical protein
MATQTTEVIQTEAPPTTVTITAETLAERPAAQVEQPTQVKHEHDDTAEIQPPQAAETKPKVRRVLDEEGGTTTATVG